MTFSSRESTFTTSPSWPSWTSGAAIKFILYRRGTVTFLPCLVIAVVLDISLLAESQLPWKVVSSAGINSAVSCSNSNKTSGAQSWITFWGTPCCHINSHKHLAMVLAVLSGTANTSGHLVK